MYQSIFRHCLKYIAKGKLSIFVFHKVPIKKDYYAPDDHSLDEFLKTLDFIMDNFVVVPLGEALSYISQNKPNDRLASLTFDDGYPDWLDGVVPCLLQRKLSATFFITTCQLEGMPLWHERIRNAIAGCSQEILQIDGLAEFTLNTRQQKLMVMDIVERSIKYKSLNERNDLICQIEERCNINYKTIKLFSTDHLRELDRFGFEIGAHTINHPILTNCSRSLAIKEIGGAKETLASIIQRPIDSFAYPNGNSKMDYLADHVGIVKDVGFRYAVTTNRGFASYSTPLLEIPRFTPWGPGRFNMSAQIAGNLLKIK